MGWLKPGLSFAAVAALGLVSFSCKREQRGYHVEPPAADALKSVRLSTLLPGLMPSNSPVKNDFEGNAQAMAEGQRLYTQYNCSGCHSQGGGGMGPALMDDKWVYGSNPEQVYATIIQGRPNGMPSWGGRIPDYQVWEIVGYVRSMSGLTSSQAAPGRPDHMKGKLPESSVPTQPPKASGIPPSASMPK